MSLYLGNTLISGVATPSVANRNIGQIVPSVLPLTDSGLHLLDGSLITRSSNQAFVDYIGNLYDDMILQKTTTYNINITGALSNVNGILSSFSNTKYATTNVKVNFSTANSWEIVTKQNLSSVGSINDGYMGVLGGAYNINYYINTANKIAVELSSNGTSYNIGTIAMTNAVTLGIDFYLKLEFTGSAYNLYYSTDGTTWTLQGTISSSTKVSNRTNYFAFGVDESGNHSSWAGSVDINKCYIKMNDNYYWTGATTTRAYFIDDLSWQSSVTNYGVCGKFVYDSVNNTVRLPKITGIVEGTTDVTALGDLVEAGLPNITGNVYNVGGIPNTTGVTADGAFSRASTTSSTGMSTGGSDTYVRVHLDASLSNSIYGNSTTVQPQTIKILYYIVITSTSGGGSLPLSFSNVSASSWVSDSTYADYGYKCELSLTGVTATMYATVTYGVAEATSGNYAPVCDTGAGTVTIYSKVNTSITIPTIIVQGV